MEQVGKAPLLDSYCPWLKCFCVVDFDLEYGQKLEYTVPQVHFHPEELTNICFLSFPDCNTEKESDSIFVFRVRMIEPNQLPEEIAQDEKYNPNHPYVDSCFYYGFAFFRQKKDSSNKRGYLQKSVVLISQHPFIGLFKKLMTLVGPMFFTYEEALLESTFQNVCNWPTPKAGHTYDLPVLGSVLTYHVSHSLFPYLVDARDGPPPVMTTEDELISNIQSVNVFYPFRKFVGKLWTLWELVLIGEPIIILSPSPVISSEAVLALVSLISPILYGGDFRPFFTIHDSDFNKYTDGSDPPASVIIGATNPFFVKALQHWPHRLTIGYNKSQAAQGSFGNFKNELKTSHKPLLPPEASVLKHLTPLSKAGSPKEANKKNNEVLRRYFASKTEQFLAPLDCYFNLHLMPREKDLNPLKPPKLGSFNESQFFLLLGKKNSISNQSVKKKQSKLYQRFFASDNFTVWYNQRRDTAIKKLEQIYVNLLANCDVKQVIKHCQTVEIIDFFMRIREQAETYGEDNELHQQLREKQEEILSVSPSLAESLKHFIG